MSLAYLNGKFMPLAEARVPALDRGFLFGDGVYEMIPFYNGIGLGETEHLQRLQKSLDAIEILSPLTTTEWHSIFVHLLDQQAEKNNIIYLQITRGAAAERLHTYPTPAINPTIFAFSKPFTPGKYSAGIRAITHEDTRWDDCYIKSLNLLANCMLSEQAVRQEANEAILWRNNIVTEGSSSNVFVVKDGQVFTTPISARILNGITRQLTLEILQQQAIPYREIDIPLEKLRDADEIWVTSSSREIAPVIKLDQHPIGQGVPGLIWQQVYPRYSKQINS